MNLTPTHNITQSRWSPGFIDFIEAHEEQKLTYYVHDWMPLLGYNTEKEIDQIMLEFIEAIGQSGYSLKGNIKSVYRCEGMEVFHDWKISSFGLAYLIFNTPVKNDQIRKLQLYILSKIH